MDMIEQDWIYGLIGGLLIGTASSIYLFFNGRVTGISGILGNAIFSPTKGTNIPFLIGLILMPAIAVRSVWEVELSMTNQFPIIIIGGLLVGFGTRLGSGCTSGHGVCGMSRLSVRSIIATCTFMFFAGLTVYLTRHVFGVVS